MRVTVPVPRDLVVRLLIALVGAGAFLAISVIQGALRAGYDPWHQSVSALSLGSGGWVQQLNFIAFGVILFSTVPVWGQVLAGGKGSTAYPALTALTAVSFVLAGVLPQDPAPGYDPESLRLTGPTTVGLFHLAVAGVAASASVAALFVMAGRLSQDAHWHGWATYTRLTGLITAAAVVTYAVWSREATGLAGTFERTALAVPAVWGFTLVRRLWAGAPLMVARRTPQPDTPAFMHL